jgi:hypothetical protein
VVLAIHPRDSKLLLRQVGHIHVYRVGQHGRGRDVLILFNVHFKVRRLVYLGLALGVTIWVV